MASHRYSPSKQAAEERRRRRRRHEKRSERAAAPYDGLRGIAGAETGFRVRRIAVSRSPIAGGQLTRDARTALPTAEDLSLRTSTNGAA